MERSKKGNWTLRITKGKNRILNLALIKPLFQPVFCLIFYRERNLTRDDRKEPKTTPPKKTFTYRRQITHAFLKKR